MDIHQEQEDDIPRPGWSSSSASHETEQPTPITPGGDQEDAAQAPASRSRRRHDSLAIIGVDSRRELERIATTRSRARRESAAGLDGGEIDATYDPVLDPSSGSFNLLKWLQNIVAELRKEGITLANTGVVFDNLTVSGTGNALQLQQTLGSLLLAPFRLGEHLSFGTRPHKTILHSFHGLVRSGELLVVLGRPGSGCSTLLKTMTGNLYGLHLDHESLINYNGIPQGQMMREFKGEAIYNQEVRSVLRHHDIRHSR